MKSKTFVMMFVAIGCGLVAAYLTARITAKQAVPESVPVLVAKERIRAGDVIKEPEKLFVEMRYPAGTTPNAIGSLEDLKGKMVNKTLQPGQWLTPDDLNSNFGIELPKGYYAMSVKVSPESSANGFILPKSRVNVVATFRDRYGNGRARVMTVLQDVLVLAVDTNSTRPEDKQAFPTVNAALLAVKPSDSQRLTLAQSLAGGDIKLVLRGHDDDTKVPLPPLDTIDTSLDATGEPIESTAVTYKLAVAKADLPEGQVIDDPDKFFKVESFPASPDKAVAAEALASLKGKTLKHALFKDGVLTTKHFEGEKLATAKARQAAANEHVMFIQNGGSAPVAVTFRNGVAAQTDVNQPPPITPPPPAEPKPEQPATPSETPTDGDVSPQARSK